MKEFNPESLPDVLQAKYLELKDSLIGKYFFLYFLHLMEYLEYKEENGNSVFFDSENTFVVPLPFIDSHEKYLELERINRNLEKFSILLKKRFGKAVNNFVGKTQTLSLLDFN
jgi:hypothetical protein